MTHTFFSRWAKICLLLTSTIALSRPAYGQANFLSLFGAPLSGCTLHQDINRMTTLVTPSATSFTSNLTLNDHWGIAISSPAIDNFKTSAYDKAGQLFFSANGDGIFAPDGSEVFGFGVDAVTGTATTLTYTSYCSTAGTIIPFYYHPTYAVSEIVIFPKPGHCNSYYVMFWCSLSDRSRSHAYQNIIRCIEVDINIPAFGNSAVPTTSWYTFTDNILDPPTGCDDNLFGEGPHFKL